MSSFPVLSPALQLGFYERLEQARKELLLPALLDQVGQLDIGKLDQQLLEFVGRERLSLVARRGLRGELVFPVPYVLFPGPFAVIDHRHQRHLDIIGAHVREDVGKGAVAVVEVVARAAPQ